MQEEYSPIRILKDVTEAELGLISAMDEYPPRTKFSPGDLATLRRAPTHLRMRAIKNTDGLVPTFWKIRFVVSRWAYELHNLAYMNTMGYERAVRVLLEESNLDEKSWRVPMIYAHGYPHGMYPDSAAWLPEYSLKRVSLAEANADWELILDEAKAPFLGYDSGGVGSQILLDYAPDLYSNGENLGAPFSHEEATFQTAAIIGLEEAMVVPQHYASIGDHHPLLVPDHDIYDEG